MKDRMAVSVLFSISLLLVITLGCDSKKKETLDALETSREKAVQGRQSVAERDREARRIINKKYEAMSRSDSRFEGYAVDAEKDVLEGEDGTLVGSVLVWEDDGDYGESPEGITVVLRDDATGSSRRARVDSQNQYAFSAPPGDYTLIVEERGYEYFEQYVTVLPGTEQLMDPIDLEKE